ncbi:MAG: DUF885 family protein, partial [Halobacteria archaeon]|nr:DUF885 family protein [Halobacteria archaeon]
MTNANDSEFDALIDDYFDAVLERNPHIATALGVHKYDSEIPRGTAESVEEEIEEAKQLRADIAEFDSPEAELAVAALDYDIYEMDELRQWEANPQAIDAVISFLYPLFARDFASLGERLELIADRLEKCPQYLEDTRERVTDPVEIWVEAELASCGDLDGFFQLIADYAGKMERQDVAYRVNTAAEDTLDSVDEYEEWLESLDTRSDWRIGGEAVDELLDKRFLQSGNE